MNEFEIRDLKVGDVIARKPWKASATVESVERGVGRDENGQPELMVTKVIVRLFGGEYMLDLEDLTADDWEWVPEGHIKRQRWLEDEELIQWVETGQFPKDWQLPTNPPVTLGEICADRMRTMQQGIDHFATMYQDLEQALLEMGDGLLIRAYELGKEIRKRKDLDSGN